MTLLLLLVAAVADLAVVITFAIGVGAGSMLLFGLPLVVAVLTFVLLRRFRIAWPVLASAVVHWAATLLLLPFLWVGLVFLPSAVATTAAAVVL